MKHFLSLTHCSDGDIQHLLRSARELQRNPRSDALSRRVLGLLFLNPSLRTLASMQAGMTQLGGSSFVLQPGASTWGLQTRNGVTMDGAEAEHVAEAVPVLGGYCDALGVRCFAQRNSLEEDASEPVLSSFAEYATKPVINLESALDHPCQALADWKTLDDLEIANNGKIALSWTWHPRALPLAVPAAVAAMAVRRGMDLTIVRPEGFGMPAPIATRLDDEAAKGGGRWRESDDWRAVTDCPIVYAKSWGATTAYGDVQADASLRADHRQWRITEPLLEHRCPSARVMHCLPVRRNVVIDDAVLDSARSVVVAQAHNRLHVQKALLLNLLENS